jgi:hypothetical protein
MKLLCFGRLSTCVIALLLLLPWPGRSAQFVELTAEIELADWDTRFFSDRIVRSSNPRSVAASPILFGPNGLVRCVVGTNSWLIEATNPNGRRVYWFTGTNMITYFEHAGAAQTGQTNCVIRASPDGNPGRPVRVADLMTFDVGGRFCWLALCSGSFLDREVRQIYPPGDLWKQSSLVYSGWTNDLTRFGDSLGLPERLDLLTTNNQPVFQYQTRHTTNVLGWTFPLEFYGVQYLPAASNVWKLHLTAKGRITAIGPGTPPHIPTAAIKSARVFPEDY